MENNDRHLQAYVKRLLDLQLGNVKQQPLTDEELKAIALEMGMTEEEYKASLNTAESCFQRGRAYVDSYNWEDAIVELTQAVTIYPNHVEANYLLGKAYMNRGLLQHNDKDFQYSDLYIDRCLQLSPLHQGALAVKSQKRKGIEQHSSVQSRSKRNQKLIAAAVAAGFLLFFAFMYILITNTMASREEQVNQSWAQVENVYQRRADLIPNLVKTVQAAANFEKETLLAVQKARSEASAIKLDLSHFDQAQFEEFVKKQQALGMAMSRLMAVAENYPQLRTSENFLALQDELEGSENRISVERKRFNEAVQAYNSKCRRFPYSFSDCQPKPYFKADQGASKAPDIDFR